MKYKLKKEYILVSILHIIGVSLIIITTINSSLNPLNWILIYIGTLLCGLTYAAVLHSK